MTNTSVPVLVKAGRANTKKKKHLTLKTVMVFAAYVLIIGFVLYAVTALTDISLQKAEKEKTFANLQSQIEVQEVYNQELVNIDNYSGEELKEYKEKVAHENGYVKRGERVFVNVAGE